MPQAEFDSLTRPYRPYSRKWRRAAHRSVAFAERMSLFDTLASHALYTLCTRGMEVWSRSWSLRSEGDTDSGHLQIVYIEPSIHSPRNRAVDVSHRRHQDFPSVFIVRLHVMQRGIAKAILSVCPTRRLSQNEINLCQHSNTT